MEFTELFTAIKIPMTIFHVVSVVFGMGAALVSDVLFTFYGEDKKLSPTEIKTLRVLSNMVWWGLVAITISGIGLFLSDIPKYAHSVKFLAKMSILAVLVVNGFVLHKFVWVHVIKRGFLVSKKEGLMRKVAFACGAVSVLSWVSVCVLGVLDHAPVSYGLILVGYGILIFGGIVVSLIIEHKTFENK